MHDRRIQAGLHALVQEHRVQHLPRGRIQAERDVGQPQRGLHVRVAPLELPDGLDRLDAVRARSPPGRSRSVKVRQSTRMSTRRHPQSPVRSSISRSAISHLLLGGAGLALLVDGQRDDGGAVLADERHGPWHSAKSGPSPSSKFTELITDRPPSISRPASSTAGSVESSTIGSVDAVANRPAISRISPAPSRPT